jgi:hypothetical protein
VGRLCGAKRAIANAIGVLVLVLVLEFWEGRRVVVN